MTASPPPGSGVFNGPVVEHPRAGVATPTLHRLEPVSTTHVPQQCVRDGLWNAAQAEGWSGGRTGARGVVDDVELAGALTRSAKGLYAQEAAVRLLVEQGAWPARLAQEGLVVTATEGGVAYAEVRWAEAVEALATRLVASGGERRVLLLAASLAGGVPVDLGDAVSGLDRANLHLVLAALSHANGSHEHAESVGEAERPGGPLVVRPGSPRLTLGPVHPWPDEGDR